MDFNRFLQTLDRISYICVIVSILAVVFVLIASLIRKRNKKKLQELKKAPARKTHGIIFGKSKGKLVHSPEHGEGMVGVFSATGTGKTRSILIPSLRSWRANSYTIDISGDICANCPNMPNKLIYAPESQDTLPYNIFGPIDTLESPEAKFEALAQLALLLMPPDINASANAKFFQDNGRKILTASLIAFYNQMDFIDIAVKVVSSSWQDLFRAIDQTENQTAAMYINGFAGASEQNTSGCKQSCDDALSLFATNHNVKRTIRRPEENELALEPKHLETHNLFVVVGEDKLNIFAPLMNIITSQIMQYIGTRQVTKDSPTILISLDEFPSLKLDADLILDAVRRFRKRKCRLILLMQNTVDLDILYGRDKAKGILANLKYKILLGGLGEPDSQKYFAELIGYDTTTKRSTAKNSKSVTRTETEEKEYRIEPAELDRQGKDIAILIASELPSGHMKLIKNFIKESP